MTDLLYFLVGVFIWLFFKKTFTIEEKEIIETPNRVNIKIEQIGEIFYAWKENDFIVQSNKIEDVIEHIRQKFPNKNYLIISNRDLEQWLTKK